MNMCFTLLNMKAKKKKNGVWMVTWEREYEPHVRLDRNGGSIFSREFLRTAMNGNCKRNPEN